MPTKPYKPRPRDILIVRAVKEAYRNHRHAFAKGCGRETMWYWVLDTTHGRIAKERNPFSKQDVRRHLDHLVERGLMVKGTAPSPSGKRGYTTYYCYSVFTKT
jgi:hypothetical protein